LRGAADLWLSVEHDRAARCPGMFCDVQTYLKERSKEVLTGTSSSIVVRKDRDLGSVAGEVEAAVWQLTFDREYHPEFLGEYTASLESGTRLLLYSLLSMVGIVLLLHVDFQSWRFTGIVMLTITGQCRRWQF
jgi:Cu/Ag efflux pump CusA